MTTFRSLILLVVSTLDGAYTASVSQSELSDLMTKLWHADVNRAGSHDVTVNLQAHTSSSATSDRASNRLFSYVNEGVLFHKPTYSTFLSLLDNYYRQVGTSEYSTYHETLEINNFLRELSKTNVMHQTLQFLNGKGYTGSTWADFEAKLRELWFNTYPRHGHVSDSSGFEHVFVGETDNTKVDGLHNWIQFYLQEKSGSLNYLGYLSTQNPHMIALHFNWFSKPKHVGSIIYGTSPEIEMAMYTICYFVRHNSNCEFSIDGHRFVIKAYDIYRNGKHHIGSSYFDV